MVSQTTETETFTGNDLFLQAFTFSGIGMAILAINGRWIKVNPALCRILGYAEDELLKTSFQELTHPNDLSANLEMAEKLIQGKIPYMKVDKRYRHKKGHYVWCRLTSSVSRMENGNAEFYISQIQDISEEKQIHNLLVEQSRVNERLQRMQTVFEHSTDGLFFTDVLDDGRFKIVEINPAFTAMSGVTEELINMPFDESKDPGDGSLSFILEKYRQVVASKKVVKFEISYNNNITLTRYIPVLDEKKKVRHIIGMSTLITQQKNYEKQLIKREQEYRSLAENAPFNIVRFDLECKATYANSRTYNLLSENWGNSLSELPLERFANNTLIRDLHQTIEYTQLIKQVIATGKNHETELQIALPNGKLVIHHLVLTPEKDVDGEIIGVLGYGYDITDRKEMEEALVESEKRIRQKLNSVLSPDTDFSGLELSDILDRKTIQHLVDEFCKVTNIALGIIDTNGKVLAKGAWQDICTKFHRAHPDSCKLCIESDVELSRNIKPGTFKQYHCKNNMWDIATPIMVGNKHMGNIFLGQFLFTDETPDTDFFVKQAQHYGYNRDEYIEAFKRVPKVSHEKVDVIMSFLASFAGLISNLSYSNLKLASLLEQQKLMKENIHQQAEFQQVLLNGIKDVGITILISEQGKVIYNNGLDSEYQMGITSKQNPEFPDFIDLVHPCERARVLDIYARRLKGPAEPESFEIGVTNIAGDRHEYEVFLAEVPDRQPAQTIILAKNITDRKIANKQLKKKQANLEEAQRLGRIGSWEFNHSTQEFEWTPEMFRIFKVNPATFTPTHKAYMEAIHPNDREMVDQVFQQSLKEKTSFDIDHRLLLSDGKVKYVSQHGITYFNNTGDPVRTIGTVRDMTKRKEAELELIEAKKKAEESNRIKSTFLATMNHELRTPLNHIIGFSRMIEWDQTKAEGYANVIQRSANHLLEIIEDIFKLALADQSGLTARNQLFDLGKMFFDSQQILVEILKNAGKEDQIKLIFELDPELYTKVISADLNKINQVLGNLFRNAVKFTSKGSIKFGIKADPDGWLFCYISDTGIGIPENKQNTIFDFFTQADDSNTRKYEGIGIGLTISKKITDVLNGKLTFDSNPDQGSTFELKVPVKIIL